MAVAVVVMRKLQLQHQLLLPTIASVCSVRLAVANVRQGIVAIIQQMNNNSNNIIVQGVSNKRHQEQQLRHRQRAKRQIVVITITMRIQRINAQHAMAHVNAHQRDTNDARKKKQMTLMRIRNVAGDEGVLASNHQQAAIRPPHRQVQVAVAHAAQMLVIQIRHHHRVSQICHILDFRRWQ